MAYSYIFHEKAQNQYEEIVQWYLEQSPKAALGFVEAIDFALLQICKYPVRWRNTYRHFHEISLRKYPYTLIYAIDNANKTAIVYKVFHHKQHPGKKFRGLSRL